jgi:hypothetical protein
MEKNENENISPELEKIYEEIVKNLKMIYQLKIKDNRDIKRFNKEYANMFVYEDTLYKYLNSFAGNISAYYNSNYNKTLKKYMKIYRKSLRNAESIFKKIINRRKRIRRYIENTIKSIKEIKNI